MAASNSYSSADAITLESQLLLIMAASTSYSSAVATTLSSDKRSDSDSGYSHPAHQRQ